MPASDREILERFHRRFALIDRQLPPVPPFRARPAAPSMVRLLAVPAITLAVLLVAVSGSLLARRPSAVGLPALAPSPPGAVATAAPTATATATPTGPSELTVGVLVETLPRPSGIVIAPGLNPYFHFGAVLSTPDGHAVATLDLRDGVPAHVTVAAGSYGLRIWRFGVVDNVDNGARETSAPIGECSTTVTLTPLAPLDQVAVFPYGMGDCSFTSVPSSPAVSCGPLDAGLCAAAVTSAEGTLQTKRPPILAIRIEAPTASRTCPPSGGPPGAHACGVIAIIVTPTGEVDVGLVRSGEGWIWSDLVR